jgi:hypothetical protein
MPRDIRTVQDSLTTGFPRADANRRLLLCSRMTRKLKIYQTSQGFFDLAMPSMKAALQRQERPRPRHRVAAPRAEQLSGLAVAPLGCVRLLPQISAHHGPRLMTPKADARPVFQPRLSRRALSRLGGSFVIRASAPRGPA